MTADNTQVMNTLLRMVVPIRREFGLNLDVKHFLHDFEYAKDILAQALGSQDQRLRDYAAYVQKLMAGPRGAAPPKPATPAPEPARAADARADEWTPTQSSIIDTIAPSSVLPEAAPGSKEDALRRRIMEKYTKGLR